MKSQRDYSPSPQSDPGPKSLAELADQIHRRFIQLEDAEAPHQAEVQAAIIFASCYCEYLAPRGRPFPATKNWLLDLLTLEEKCRGKVPAQLDGSLPKGVQGEWSQPMSKTKIKAALGLPSFYMLDTLAKESVYTIRQSSNSYAPWRAAEHANGP